MREENGRFYQFSSSEINPEGVLVQDGYVENLLCLECEGRFQRWEEYVARQFNQRQSFDIDAPPNGRNWVRLSGFEYPKLKLFLMSVLWRCSVCQHPRFTTVRLGEHHQERLRDLLLSGEPGEPEEYGCILAAPYVELGDGQERQNRPQATVTPDTVRFEHGLRLVRMQIDGLVLQFPIGNLELIRRHNIRHLFLQRDGTVVMGIENMVNISYLREAWGRTLGFIR